MSVRKITSILMYTLLTYSCPGMALAINGYSEQAVIDFVTQKRQTIDPQYSNKPEETNMNLGNLDNFKTEAQQIIKNQIAAHGGGGLDGGGGGHLAQEFFKVANSVLNELKIKNSQKIDVEALEMAIKTVEVEFVSEELLLNGIRKDAINYPEKFLIKYNIQAWNNIQSTAAKCAMVLHELLGIMKVKDSGYHISYYILGATDLKVVVDPSLIETIPGSLLNSYDLLVGEMIRLNKSSVKADKKNALVLAKSILATFFGFTDIIEKRSFLDIFTNGTTDSEFTLIHLAARFRNLASYDPNSNSFLRFSDGYRISAGSYQQILMFKHNIRLQLILESGDKYSFASSHDNSGAQLCTITLGYGPFFVLEPQMKQLFANALNCGRLSTVFDTNIQLFENSDSTPEEPERKKKNK